MIVRYGRQTSKKITARVVTGVGRGHNLGFPTANLDKLDVDMPYGVYAAEVILNGKSYKAAVHFGPKDTFSEGLSNEVLIKDFSGDIYGQVVEVEILRKLRDIKKFESTEELKEAIKKDLASLG